MTAAVNDILILLIYVYGVTVAGGTAMFIVIFFYNFFRAWKYKLQTGCNRRTAYKKFHIY